MPDCSRTAPADPEGSARVCPLAQEQSAKTVARAVLLSLVGLGACWVVMGVAGLLPAETAGGARPTETTAWRTVQVVAVLVATATPWSLRLLAPRRWSLESVVLASASALLAGSSLAALRGTAWGFDGLYSDAGFRTETVTRYASSPALADYAYRGLTAYYPPLWPWLQGRAADLLGLSGWQVMKPAQIAVCLVIVPLGWLQWRRALTPVTGAWVAAAVAVLTAIPNKPDEWLVLCLLLPWWLEVCRGLRRPEVRAGGVVRHGLILGLLLLCHTYFFAPLAVATAIGMALDVLARRPVTPRFPAALGIGAVGILVATPTWWHLAVARVAGLPGDDLQRRWSPPGFDLPPHPLPIDPRGLLEAAALIWLVIALRRSRPAAELLLVLLTGYVFMVGGQLLQPWGVAVLPEKSSELIEATYAVAAVLGVRAGWSAWRRRSAPSPTARRAAVTAVAVLSLLAAGQAVGRGMADPSRPAQSMRYPDGSFPAGGPVPASPRWHPWGVLPGETGPSVSQVDNAWRELTGRRLGPDDVLISARADVAAITPVHLFITWKSIYSHPHAQFDRRLTQLRTLERCDDAACAWEALRRSGLDPVDGLVLNTDADGPYLTVTVDDFPEGWTRQRVSVRPDLLRAPWFRVAEVRGVLVVAVRPAAA